PRRADLRRTARARLLRLDRPEADPRMVGGRHGRRGDGRPSRRHLPVQHRLRRRRGRVPRGRRARAARADISEPPADARVRGSRRTDEADANDALRDDRAARHDDALRRRGGRKVGLRPRGRRASAAPARRLRHQRVGARGHGHVPCSPAPRCRRAPECDTTKRMRRGVTVLVGLLAVVTAAGFLDRVSWVFEPATVFRLQYVVLLLAAALLAVALRQRYLVVAAVALAAVNIAAIAPWQHGSRSAASSADPTLRIVAFNVKSGNHRYDQLAPLIARLKPDILGLIELTPGWARAAESASSHVRPRRLVV